MTISTSSSQVTIAATGAQTGFQFPFVGVSSSDITVSSISSSGKVTTYSPSQYTISLNAATTNQLWGIGGTVSFSTAPAAGTSILIQRAVPYTQQISVQNQGNYYAQVTEQALDVLCMELQQQVGRTTQFRGTWLTNTAYNIGDIVQDGTNGADTLNYYICTVANTSGTWSTDLANGDWSLSVLATVPTTNQMITLSGAISGSGTTSIPTGIPANTLTFSQMNKIPGNTVLFNTSASSANIGSATIAQFNSALGSFLRAKRQTFTSSGTYTPSAGMVFCDVWGVGGGGAGGGVPATAGCVGAGGAAGSEARLIISAASIGSSQPVTIGVGGIGGTGNGGTGGTTALGSSISCLGGLGGSVGVNVTSVVGGAGQTAIGGDFNGTGAPGGPGTFNGAANAESISGVGGSSSVGGGAISVGGGSAATGGVGIANTGGGGSGAAAGAGTQKTGGPGGTGLLTILEYCTQ